MVSFLAKAMVVGPIRSCFSRQLETT